MDGLMDGRTEGRTDGRTDGWMDGSIHRLFKAIKDVSTDTD